MIVVSLRKWLAWAKFLVLFVALTVLLYKLFQLFSDWAEPADRYKPPTGSAVKAFREERAVPEAGAMLDRLLFFYRYGE